MESLHPPQYLEDLKAEDAPGASRWQTTDRAAAGPAPGARLGRGGRRCGGPRVSRGRGAGGGGGGAGGGRWGAREAAGGGGGERQRSSCGGGAGGRGGVGGGMAVLSGGGGGSQSMCLTQNSVGSVGALF